MKDYFSHDYNARNDKKLIKLFMQHGLSGLGAYWCIIEMLYEESGYLPLSEYERITFELRTTNELIKSVLNDFDLFQYDCEKFWSETAIERLKKRSEKSDKARESISKRWEKYERITNEKQTNTKRNTIKESKVKEKKVKEIIYPTISEVQNYFIEKGYTNVAALKFFDYYSVANWKDSKGNTVKNWKQKAQAVWFKPENEMQKPKIKQMP
jgi:hypothetical protein